MKVLIRFDGFTGNADVSRSVYQIEQKMQAKKTRQLVITGVNSKGKQLQ